MKVSCNFEDNPK